jgi:DNA-directed RNA polymerase specialized sigma subunit
MKTLFDQTKTMKERSIENYLRFYKTYQVGIKNCEQQLEYIMPSLVTRYEISVDTGESFWIVNNTEKVALDRIESKRALNLHEEIECYKLVITSIENALKDLKQQEKDFVNWRYFECLPIHEVKMKLGYSEEKSVYRIRRHVLDKLMISLKNLLTLK